MSSQSSRTRFSCTKCGDCCTGNQVVRLTGGDLVLLVERLGLSSVVELRRQGVVALVREPVGGGQFAWRPRLRFRTKPLVQCAFLVNDLDPEGHYQGLCSLHPDLKPLVCALSPLSREVTDSATGGLSEAWTFVPPVEACPGVGHGEPLALEAPANLRSRLADEVAWMRYLIAGSASCFDESAAWELLAQWKAPR